MAALTPAGAQSTTPRIRGHRGLTPSEQQIARLAASGASNREIAARLVISLRTVEMHLTSVYRKLGVAGRPGLSAAWRPPAGQPDQIGA